jgi:hypothetical protein
MIDIVSFVGGGALLIFLYFIFQLVTNSTNLYLLKYIELINFKKSWLSLVLITLLSSIIGLVLILNNSYTRQLNQEINQKIGVTDFQIYKRDNSAFSNDEIVRINQVIAGNYSQILSAKIERISIFADGKENEDIILLSANSSEINTYLGFLEEIDYSRNTIITNEFSQKYNLQVGDEIRLKNSSAEIIVKIGEIIEPNGLVGFSFYSPNRLKEYEGGIFVSESDFASLNKEGTNILLYQSQNKSEEFFINSQERLRQINRNIIIEEIKNNYFNFISGGFQGLSLPQIVLLIMIFPFLALMILIYNIERSKNDEINILKDRLFFLGLTHKEISSLMFFELFIKSFLTTVIGIVVAYALYNSLNLFFNLSNLNSINIQFIVFLFSSIFIIVFFILLTFETPYLGPRTILSFKSMIYNAKSFAFPLLIIFLAVSFLILFNFTEYGNNEWRFANNFYALQTTFAGLAYISYRLYDSINEKIKFFSFFFLAFINSLPLSLWSNNFQSNDIIIFIKWIIFIFFAIGFFILISSKIVNYLLRKKLIGKNFFLAIKIFASKIIYTIILFNIILLFNFIIAFSVNIYQNTNNLLNQEAPFDIYLTDELSFNSPLKIQEEFSNKAEKISIFVQGVATLPEIEVADLVENEISAEIKFRDNVFFVNKQYFEGFDFTDSNLFFENEKYVLLSSNYTFRDDYPKFQKGEVINLIINGVSLNREIIGFIDSDQSTNQGIYLSLKDYANLYDEELFLSSNYAIKLNESNENFEEIKNNFVEKNFSTILIRDEFINITLAYLNNFIVIITLMVYVVFVILSIVLKQWMAKRSIIIEISIMNNFLSKDVIALPKKIVNYQLIIFLIMTLIVISLLFEPSIKYIFELFFTNTFDLLQIQNVQQNSYLVALFSYFLLLIINII